LKNGTQKDTTARRAAARVVRTKPGVAGRIQPIVKLERKPAVRRWIVQLYDLFLVEKGNKRMRKRPR
jgi:hypothetical protein